MRKVEDNPTTVRVAAEQDDSGGRGDFGGRDADGHRREHRDGDGRSAAYRTAARGHRTRIEVEHRWAAWEADVIVVPGGGYTRRDGPGIWAEIDSGVLPRALAAAPRRGLTISSLCTGALLLSAAGLTKGRPCTTHHGAKAELEAQGGVVKDARVVDDTDLVTAGGITSGLELGLWLVNRELGAVAATGVEGMLEYEARGTVWTASSSS
ncbi:DJ-1/PfpI family protein [Streptomyces sp. NPDC000941]